LQRLRESKESPDVNLSVNAAASVAPIILARSQEQIKAELVELDKAVQEEATALVQTETWSRDRKYLPLVR
jgi:hypothetical protein